MERLIRRPMPVPLALGGKERIEDLICLLRGQSDAGITDRQHKLLVLRPL
jgi:hypothetical protein